MSDEAHGIRVSREDIEGLAEKLSSLGSSLPHRERAVLAVALSGACEAAGESDDIGALFSSPLASALARAVAFRVGGSELKPGGFAQALFPPEAQADSLRLIDGRPPEVGIER
jgi:hypothetical protein